MTTFDPALGLTVSKPVNLADLPGFSRDDLTEFWPPFVASCASIVNNAPELRKAVSPSAALRAICVRALAAGPSVPVQDVRSFIREYFSAHLVGGDVAEPNAFFTAYYRPEIRASLFRTSEYREPLLSRPNDLVTLSPGENGPGLTGLSSARRGDNGTLYPYPTRAEIDAGALGDRVRPIAFVKDAVEAFMIHVQGSARLLLNDGRRLDLTYAGRNGRPYTSIGRILIERGQIDQDQMSLDRLKAWVRENGQEPGDGGRDLLQANQSFVFFSANAADIDQPGPIGAAGLPLTPLRSIATDRSIWPYGLPFWIDAEIPWRAPAEATPFRRLMVGQDTGTAIVGPARADLFFGDGDDSGRRAGNVRHRGRMYVLLPKGDQL